jgi:hypothetical protein
MGAVGDDPGQREACDVHFRASRNHTSQCLCIWLLSRHFEKGKYNRLNGRLMILLMSCSEVAALSHHSLAARSHRIHLPHRRVLLSNILSWYTHQRLF